MSLEDGTRRYDCDRPTLAMEIREICLHVMQCADLSLDLSKEQKLSFIDLQYYHKTFDIASTVGELNISYLKN